MGMTVRDVLVNALENLGKRGFKKFRAKLHDFEVDEGYKTISRVKLEDRDCDDVADLIRIYYKDVYGIEVTLAVLDAINEKEVAKELENDLKKVDGFERLKQSVESGERTTPTARPVITSLGDNGEMKYSFTLEKLCPRYAQIEWTCGVGESLETVPSRYRYTEQPDNKFTVCSEVRISENLLKNPECRVCVSWVHQYTNSQGQQELSIRDPDFLWTPVVEEIQTPRLFHNTPVTLQCNISGYFPDSLIVKWLRSKKQNQELCEESDDVSIPRIKPNKNADNTYSCTAKLMITPTLRNHQGAEYICRVEHPSLENVVTKRTGKFSMMAKPQAEPIKVTLDDNLIVQFSLNLKMFYPKDIKIRWHRDETQPRKGVRQSTKHTETFTENDDFLFDVTSECGILGCSFADPQYELFVSWDHESMDGPETRALSVRDLPWSPQVGKIIVIVLLDNQKTRLRCNITGYYPDVITLSWLKKAKRNVSAVPVSKDFTSEVLRHQGKRSTCGFGCTAILYFTPTVREDQGSEFILRVEHPSMEHPVERSTGPLEIREFCPPHVGDIIIPTLEDNKEVTLTCDVSGYYPDELSIKWFRKENGSLAPLPNNRYEISGFNSYNREDRTYTRRVHLTFIPILISDRGVELICRVNHTGLENPIERSTGPLIFSVISVGI